VEACENEPKRTVVVTGAFIVAAVPRLPAQQARRSASRRHHVCHAASQLISVSPGHRRKRCSISGLRIGRRDGPGEAHTVHITFNNNNNRDYPVRNGLQFRVLLGQSPPRSGSAAGW